MSFDVRTVLELAAYLPEEMERLLDKKHPSFVKFDPELGYVLLNYIFRDGMNDALSVYTYEEHGGHRKMINYADAPCRINTYGDSFTQCAQVSDGETWQEILAAHIREPMRNFGVGGYGVYQAYLLSRRIEAVEDLSAEYVILNIWDEDHYRNLDAARWYRVAWMHREIPRGGGPDTYPAHGFPWAHVRFDLDKGDFVELPGRCRNEEDLAKLADKEYYYNFFKDDPVVHLFTLREGGEAPVGNLEKLAEAFGLKVDLRQKDVKRRSEDAWKLHTAYGIKSTIFIVKKMRRMVEDQGKKFMVLLSYDTPQVKTFIEKGTRLDTELVKFLQESGMPYVDTLKKSAEEYKAYKISVNEFLERLYIARAGAQVFGHYNPYGNFWFAFAIKDELVEWLDPKPPAYR